MILTVGGLQAQRPIQPPVVRVRGATIIAFFPPPEAADDADGGANESLDDFRFYAEQVRQPLSRAGVNFQVLYARSLRVRLGTGTILFHTKGGVGYYLISPGKKPLVQYGVMTDSDLLLVAKRYFGRAGFGE